MSLEKNQAKALLEIWTVLVRFRWRFIVPAFAVAAIVLATGMVLPRKYRAEAIFDRRTDMVLAEITSHGGPRSFQDPKQAITEELAGSPAIEALQRKLDITLAQTDKRLLAGRESFYNDLSRRIVIRSDFSDRDHDRIRIEYVGSHPVRARMVVNTLVENYIDHTRAIMEERLKKTSGFFQTEVQRFRQEIETLENKRLAFEIEHDLLLPDAANGIQTILAEHQAALTEVTAAKEIALHKVKALQEELEKTPATIPQIVRGQNPQKQRFKDQLRAAEDKLANYIGVLKMTERHPDLVALQQQIEVLSRELAATEDNIITHTEEGQNPKRSELEMKLAESRAQASAMAAQAQAFQEQIREFQARSAQIYPVRSDYRKLTSEVDQAYRRLNFWEDNLRRVQMAMAAESGNRGVQLDFIKPCGELTRPISPNLFQVLAASVLLAVLAGALSVFFAFRTDETFTDGEQLSQMFNLPLIGNVSEIISAQQGRLRRMRQLFIYPAQTAGMVVVLLMMASLLYLNLERPALFNQLTNHPLGFIHDHLLPGSQSSDREPVTKHHSQTPQPSSEAAADNHRFETSSPLIEPLAMMTSRDAAATSVREE